MRTIAKELRTEQDKNSKRTALRIAVGDYVFTSNGTEVGTTTCQNTSSSNAYAFTTNSGNRILGIPHLAILPWGKDPNTKSSTIILNNTDGFLYNLNLEGQRCYVGWGLQTDRGPFYSTDPTMYVSNVAFSEAEGQKVCVLTLIGMMDWLASDTAATNYNCNGTDTTKVLVEAIIGATLTPFSGQKAFTLDDSAITDENYTTFIPGPTFRIKKGDTRAATLARLLDMTTVKLKPGNDATSSSKDTIHAIVPSTTLDNVYSLEDEDQPFFTASEAMGIIRPNKITVKSTSSDTTQYTGVAQDNVSYLMMPSERTEYIYGLTGVAQACSVAQAILANIRSYYNASAAKVPMNYGQEIYDRVKIISKRTGRTYEGNIVSITKVYNPQKSEPESYMTIAFGKYYDPRSVIDTMGIGAGFINTGYDVAQRVYVPAISYSSYSGTLSLSEKMALALSSYALRDDDGDWIKWKPVLPESVYTMRFGLYKKDDAGIAKVYIDDVLIGTYDMYSASDDATIVEESVTLTATDNDIHTVKLLVDGKNASSSDYIIRVGPFEFIP